MLPFLGTRESRVFEEETVNVFGHLKENNFWKHFLCYMCISRLEKFIVQNAVYNLLSLFNICQPLFLSFLLGVGLEGKKERN